jgi:hypothetical protein
LAAASGNVNVCRLLVEQSGADVNAIMSVKVENQIENVKKIANCHKRIDETEIFVADKIAHATRRGHVQAAQIRN